MSIGKYHCNVKLKTVLTIHRNGLSIRKYVKSIESSLILLPKSREKIFSSAKELQFETGIRISGRKIRLTLINANCIPEAPNSFHFVKKRHISYRNRV